MQALQIDLYNNAGNSLDLSGAIMDRALFHSDNVYRIPNVLARGHVCKTNLPSNTAFRGFGGPQVGQREETAEEEVFVCVYACMRKALCIAGCGLCGYFCDRHDLS